MATKTYNPTANPFELLHVDEEPEKRPRNPKQKQAGGGGQPQQQPQQPVPGGTPVVMETPAQKSERRAKAKAEKDRQAEALKKQQEQEKALAALMPDDGFQVQKGFLSKKPADGEKKKTVMNREEYEKNPHTDQQQPRKFPQQQNKQPGKTPFMNPPREPRANDSGAPIQKQFGNNKSRQRDPQGENPSRPPKHEGFDKQSGHRTTQKHTSKKDASDWGNPVQDWNHGGVTENTPSGGGWGGDEAPSQAAATPLSTEGWGDDGAKSQPSTPANEDASNAAPAHDAPPAKPRKPAWDEEEGYGKMLFDEFERTVAAQRHAALRELAPAKKPRSADAPADLSKFVEKKVIDANTKIGGQVEKKEKKLPPQKPQVGQPQPLPQAKPAVQPRPNEKQVEVSALFDVRQRGGAGRGRGGGGPAASRDRGATDRPQSDTQGSPKPKPQGPRAGYPGGRNKVPGAGSHNQFPDLPTVNKTAPAEKTAQAVPK